MHDSVRDFFSRMKKERPSVFSSPRVAEIGSYDINGNPRSLFRAAGLRLPEGEYLGIDWRPGPNVDEVAIAHDYRGRGDGYFNTVISSSMLEHDPFWKESLGRMLELLAIDGSLLITTTAPGFHEHEVETSPAGPLTQQGTYFQNRTMFDILDVITDEARFLKIFAEDDPVNHDIRLLCFLKLPPAGATALAVQ